MIMHISKFVNNIPIWCIDITFPEKDQQKNLHLCTGCQIVERNNKLYFPYSGLEIITANFNENCQDRVEISGVFDANGISKELHIEGTNITISFTYMDILTTISQLICTEFQVRSNDFTMILEPISIKYDKQILLKYSKTCRADFGDEKCNIDVAKYKLSLVPQSITSNEIIIEERIETNGFYNDGQIIFNGYDGKHIQRCKIESQSARSIRTYDDIIITKKQCATIELIPSCDKQFSTCCKKYQNWLNFRGEPNLPTNNFIKL